MTGHENGVGDQLAGLFLLAPGGIDAELARPGCDCLSVFCFVVN
jgi:hypothetical protein